MDRAPTFKLPLGASEIGRHLGLGTVLDGELVYNMTIKKEVFLIFDVLSIDGEICAHEPFERRLQIMKERIEPRLRSLLSPPPHPNGPSASSSPQPTPAAPPAAALPAAAPVTNSCCSSSCCSCLNFNSKIILE